MADWADDPGSLLRVNVQPGSLTRPARTATLDTSWICAAGLVECSVGAVPGADRNRWRKGPGETLQEAVHSCCRRPTSAGPAMSGERLPAALDHFFPFPVRSQSTDLPNSRLMASSRDNGLAASPTGLSDCGRFPYVSSPYDRHTRRPSRPSWETSLFFSPSSLRFGMPCKHRCQLKPTLVAIGALESRT